MTFSRLSAYAEQFLALRRTVAKINVYQLRHREKLLRSFLSYWREHGCPWPIRGALLLDWIAVGSNHQQPYRDQRRFYVVRAFLQQVRTFEPATEIPENIYRPLYNRRTPHLYSEHDIARLMDAVWRLRVFDQFRLLTIHTLIGVLASTGMRIGEALDLKVEEAQLNAVPPHLLIQESKFGKSRHVVLHPSTAQQLRQYLLHRSKALRRRPAEFFFTNRQGKHLNYNVQRLTFLRLLKRAGIEALPGQRRPSLHSFRHSFAVRRLTLWHQRKKDVQQLLPHLAVYLGHLGPENTYWYVSSTPELLQAAAALFEHQHAKGGVNR